jgi:shikimate kinase
MKGSNLYLVGFMGAGKTEVGRRLAELLGWPFIDLDLVIEKQDGASVAEIFSRRGEAYFRSLERVALHRVSLSKNSVAAVWGCVF